MTRAYRQVMSNKGGPGIDGMTVEELGPYLQRYWPEIKSRLLDGSYKPSGVRAVQTPKPKGGYRELGIPTVLDRLIQQALHQILNPLFDPSFSSSSYGFRPGHNAHEAIKQARDHQRTGHRWVVDVDLEKFFDQVNHDVLITRIRDRMNDKHILRLIRRYLETGVMVGGIVSRREKGTPQGSPLSPLLSNIMLDQLDKELERRGHKFCRYADDIVVYVKSKRAGERVLDSLTSYVELKLRLKVNRSKSAVSRPWTRTFLGYSFTRHQDTRLRVPQEIQQRFRRKLKALFRQGRGRNVQRFINETLNPVLRGWIHYFRLSDTKGFAEDLDSWIRRRLRTILWRQWKKPRTRRARLLSAGLSEERATQSASNGRGPWWNAGASHMNQAYKKNYFTSLGLVSMLEILIRFRNYCI